MIGWCVLFNVGKCHKLENTMKIQQWTSGQQITGLFTRKPCEKQKACGLRRKTPSPARIRDKWKIPERKGQDEREDYQWLALKLTDRVASCWNPGCELSSSSCTMVKKLSTNKFKLGAWHALRSSSRACIAMKTLLEAHKKGTSQSHRRWAWQEIHANTCTPEIPPHILPFPFHMLVRPSKRRQGSNKSLSCA